MSAPAHVLVFGACCCGQVRDLATDRWSRPTPKQAAVLADLMGYLKHGIAVSHGVCPACMPLWRDGWEWDAAARSWVNPAFVSRAVAA